MGPLCHAWPFLSSSSCSMMLLSSPLLAVDCFPCSPLGRPGPPSPSPPRLAPFSLDSRQHPTFLSDTVLHLLLGTCSSLNFIEKYLKPTILKIVEGEASWRLHNDTKSEEVDWYTETMRFPLIQNEFLKLCSTLLLPFLKRIRCFSF